MFYSQFILAKKGPLGTIWIAAHLERKLRKNQVADTDIGDSVDSILSPDVPIALRLSSHLLLGVVRIYSRKVNYLFDDCSEALLKVKQAFRSAAVDLPPEESKAPYHSITLPETFDLDDFELPDNDLFHGGFVDHHISSRDQITLQDAMDGTGYSTSKFGLDERFGDGDASGVDLDEELFLNKIATVQFANERVDPADVSMTPLEQDELPKSRSADSANRVDADPSSDHADSDDHADFMDDSQAPCTPGPVDEPNLSNVQAVSVCEDHLESEHPLVESTRTEKAKNIYEDKQEVDWSSIENGNHDATHVKLTAKYSDYRGGFDINIAHPPADLDAEYHLVELPVTGNTENTYGDRQEGDLSSIDNENSDAPRMALTVENGDRSCGLDINFPMSVTDYDVEARLTEASSVPCPEGLQIGSTNKENYFSVLVHRSCGDHQIPSGIDWEKTASEISGLTSSLPRVSEDLLANDHRLIADEVHGSMGTANGWENSCFNVSNSASENLDRYSSRNPDQQTSHLSLLNLDTHEKVAFTETPFLLPFKSNIQPPDPGYGSSVDADVQSGVVVATSGWEEMGIQASRGPEGHVNNVRIHDGLLENHDKSAKAALPSPEKLLSVPQDLVDLHRNMIVEGIPGEYVQFDEGDAGSKIMSSKKRSFTESVLTEQSLNSVESSRLVHFKRTIPDDDDLLSSILAGRSSVLKVKPTPRNSDATSTKRARSARTGALKRKVLMDDTMVMHGEKIRQQLMNTEDIRRVRKKAPCTLSEIQLIQKQSLGDEIFLEPVNTGMPVQLSSLHSQLWNLNGISICYNDLNGVPLQIVADPGLPLENDKNGVSIETFAEMRLDSDEIKNEYSIATTAEPHLASENFENDQNPDAKIGDESRGLDNAEQSGMSNTSNVFLDNGCEVVAEQSDNPLPNNSKIKEFSDKSIGEEQTEGANDVQADLSKQELLLDSSGAEKDLKNHETINSSGISGVVLFDNSGDEKGNVLDIPPGFVQPGSATETSETNTSNKADTSFILLDQRSDLSTPELGSVVNVDKGQTINELLSTEKDGCINAAFEAGHVVRDDFIYGAVKYGDGVDMPSNAEHEHVASTVYPTDMHLGSDDFMNSDVNPQAYPNYVIDTCSAFDLFDQEEFKYGAGAVDNNTEFLNVDDDDDEVADDLVPEDEEARFAENTGWSSRTRAVSKYLQTLFVKEAEFGNSSLSLNTLLIGKSRKEASRMFFESLVLKTRDYIHVEQQNPFDDIRIKPRIRLLKSDF